MDSAANVFSDLTVLDLSESIPGRFAARMFADYGARVIRHATAQSAALPTEALLHLDSGKRVSVCADGCAGVPAAGAADAGAPDIVIVDVRSAHAAEQLRARFPQSIIARSRPYPRAMDGAPESELVFQALAGTMYINGLQDRAPLFGVGHRVQFVAGVALYSAVVAALLQKLEEARVDPGYSTAEIEICTLDVALSLGFNLANQYWANQTFDERWEKYTPEVMLQCSDGWIGIFPYADRWESICTILGADELRAHPDLQTPADRIKHWRVIHQGLEALTSQIESAELVDAFRGDGQVVAVAQNAVDLLDHPHWIERGFWRDIGGGAMTLGDVFRISTEGERKVAPPVCDEGSV